MPKNRVQFQRGMSLSQFMVRYGTEAQCEQALFAWRWPAGFICPECGHGGHCVLGRGLFQCHRCRRQTSLTAGTLLAGTKLALTQWLLAIYLLTQSKTGISALNLSRQLGVCYNSAWLLKHKLMQAMREREQGRLLAGVIQLDDAYWGGRRRGYKRGRGTRGKTPFVAAVATDPASGKPLTMRMDRVRGFRRREIGRWSRKHLAAAAPTSIPMACAALPQSSKPAAFMSRWRPAAPRDGNDAMHLSGSIRCWVTSRTPCTEPTMRFAPSICPGTSPNSATASTGASISPAWLNAWARPPCSRRPCPTGS